jgi:hypothetical protein
MIIFLRVGVTQTGCSINIEVKADYVFVMIENLENVNKI